MQTAFAMVSGHLASWTLPAPDEEVMPGVPWGAVSDVLSPAYWTALARTSPAAAHGFVCLDGNLAAEVGFCLLGGHGVTAEVALAAYERLAGEGVFEAKPPPDAERILEALQRPLNVEGRQIRYRFPRQRSTRIAQALVQLQAQPMRSHDPRLFRADLMQIPGIGPKTASWIVRNHTGSDAVAILDIHIVRACQVMRVFGRDVRLPRDYERLEDLFLTFARRIGVDAAVLDAIMWSQMRRLPLDITRPC
jgi:N-glycosylase/DNA lyase